MKGEWQDPSHKYPDKTDIARVSWRTQYDLEYCRSHDVFQLSVFPPVRGAWHVHESFPFLQNTPGVPKHLLILRVILMDEHVHWY